VTNSKTTKTSKHWRLGLAMLGSPLWAAKSPFQSLEVKPTNWRLGKSSVFLYRHPRHPSCGNHSSPGTEILRANYLVAGILQRVEIHTPNLALSLEHVRTGLRIPTSMNEWLPHGTWSKEV
jgi:hypothetical protein